MADQDKVDGETGAGQPVTIQPIVIIGHGEDGKLSVVAPGAPDIFRALAFVRAAERYLLDKMVFDRTPQSKIALVPGLPPGMKGRRVH